MIWFTSDWHLGHEAILEHCEPRSGRFHCVEEMDAAILGETNAALNEGDQLWHLGDFCWRASKAGHYRQQLRRGVKLHIVRGNHDASSLARQCSSFHEIVVRRFVDKTFHLCHYPLFSWYQENHGGYHLYGHCHGSMEAALNALQPGRMAMDVGIDAAAQILGHYRPFSVEEVLNILRTRPLGSS